MWNETKNRYGRNAADHGDPAVQRISDIRDRIDTGFFGGLIMDLLYPGIIGFNALIYMWIGYVCGYFYRIFYDDDIKTPLLLCSISDLAYGLCCYLFRFLMRGRIHLFFYLRRIIIPEVVYTLLVTLVIYRLIYRINQWLAKSDKRSMDRFA